MTGSLVSTHTYPYQHRQPVSVAWREVGLQLSAQVVHHFPTYFVILQKFCIRQVEDVCQLSDCRPQVPPVVFLLIET